jgi:hypothetical protein
VGEPARFTLVYEVGPEGVAQAGSVAFEVSPFVKGWSFPQDERPDARGYTVVTTSADDIELEVATVPPRGMRYTVTGRALVAGDRLRIQYGAGPGLARAGQFAEKLARFWVAVDGDGDGSSRVLADSPGVEVRPGEPRFLIVTLPATAHPGDAVLVRVALLDRYVNAFPDVSGEVVFEQVPNGLELPEKLTLRESDRGQRSIEARVRIPGVYRLKARFGSIRARSNPLVVDEDGPRVLWADLHGHSTLSDGTGSASDYFRYARDVAGLDVAALTDHDHTAKVRLDQHPEIWQEITATTRSFHRPGEFVTLLGYEWTNWLHGHRHVLYFDDTGELFSSADPATDTPRGLWQALTGRDALTFAHHSAGSVVPTNWNIPPDPTFEPVTEIVSNHGSSESADTVVPIKAPVAGNYVRDALGLGYRLGFVGSGDTHDGHPGLSGFSYKSGGLAAILSEDRTRAGVLEALRARRVYATNGRRIVLRVTLDGRPMGSTVAAGGGARGLAVRVEGTGPIERVEVVRSGAVVEQLSGAMRPDFSAELEIEGLERGEYLYVRVVQRDGGAAWSSPFFSE